jgi:hypothetical protein
MAEKDEELKILLSLLRVSSRLLIWTLQVYIDQKLQGREGRG